MNVNCLIWLQLTSALSKKPAPHTYTPTSFPSDHHVVLCRPVECSMIWARFQHSNERNQPHMIAADISHDNEHVSTCFEGLTRNPTVCCSVAMLWLVGQTRWPLFVFFFAQNSCDDLNGSSYSDDRHLHGSLEPSLLHNATSMQWCSQHCCS